MGIFESYTLLLATFGAMQAGALYLTIFGYILMTVAFSEMITLIAKAEKEEKIQIKSQWVQWYLYCTIQFAFLPKTWLTPELLVASGFELTRGSLLDMVLFQYHDMIVFLLLTSYLIFFVTSLQIGFYGYQFKQLGWTIMSALTIVMGCTGLILSLWRCRMWFFFAVITITTHNVFDFIVNKYTPLRIHMLNLKPEATMEGFVAGVLASFSVFLIVSSSWKFSHS